MKPYNEIAERVLQRRDAYAELRSRRQRTALRLLPAALSLVLVTVIVSAAVLFPAGAPSETHRPSGTDTNGRLLWSDTRTYADLRVMSAERAFLLPWKYLTEEERYRSLRFGDTEYTGRGTAVDGSLLGDRLGTATVTGYDPYEERTHTETVTVYAIREIPEALLVAVRFPEADSCFVFRSDAAETAPATLGDLLDLCALSTYLPLTEFSRYDPKDAASDALPPRYTLKREDSAALYAILDSARSAPAAPQFASPHLEKRLTFTASSAALGVENHAFTVTEEGYLWTNLLDFGYAYFIGTERAAELIAYATAHGTETARPSRYYLTGTVTELGDGVLKLDDSIVMQDPEDGVTFTVSLADLRIRRYFDCGYLGVGDVVRFTFDGKIYDGDPPTVETVYAVDEAIVSGNGDVWIPE